MAECARLTVAVVAREPLGWEAAWEILPHRWYRETGDLRYRLADVRVLVPRGWCS